MQYSDDEDVDHVVGGVRGYSNATGQKLEFSDKAKQGLAAYRHALLELKDLFPSYTNKEIKYMYTQLRANSLSGAEGVLEYLQSEEGSKAARGGKVRGGFNFMDLFPVLQGIAGSGRGGIAVGGDGEPLGGIAVGGRKRCAKGHHSQVVTRTTRECFPNGGMQQTGYGGSPLGGIAVGGRKRKGGIALGGQKNLSGRTYCPQCQGSGFFDDVWSGLKDVGSVALKVAPLLL